jgi:hypothetical protein
VKAAAAARYLSTCFDFVYFRHHLLVQGRFSGQNFLLRIAPPRASSLFKTTKNISHGSECWYSEFVREVLSRYLGPGNYLLLFQENPINVTSACIQTKYDSGLPRLHAWFALDPGAATFIPSACTGTIGKVHSHKQPNPYIFSYTIMLAFL